MCNPVLTYTKQIVLHIHVKNVNRVTVLNTCNTFQIYCDLCLEARLFPYSLSVLLIKEGRRLQK